MSDTTMMTTQYPITKEEKPTPDARPILPWAAFFLGDVRDGLPMINMQAVFLVSACNYKEKQIGMLFLTFGLAQTLLMAPAGYFLDYSNKKILYLVWAAVIVSGLTVMITLGANHGSSLAQQVILHAMQGGCSAIIPPAFNGITLGITGQAGLTKQVSRNRMMNHLGTAFLVSVSCLTAYYSFPNFSVLFMASPISAMIAIYILRKIPSRKIHRDAARGLILESPTMNEYCLADDVAECKLAALKIRQSSSQRSTLFSSTPPYQPPLHDDSESSDFDELPVLSAPPPKPGRGLLDATFTSYSEETEPSFRFGWPKVKTEQENEEETTEKRALSPFEVLSDPLIRIFAATCFFFHLSNSSVLPLVMQSLALEDQRSGILLSGLCIFIAQSCMAFVARACGGLSTKMGRKPFVVLGLASLSIRCFLLALLTTAEDWFVDYFAGEVEAKGTIVLKCLILSTQLLDSVGAGIMGIMQILVTSDISGGSGRFSFVFGVVTSAMCLGCTVSGYLGQAIAQDYGYEWAFTAMGFISLVPVTLFALCMPETLPDFTPVRRSRRQRFREWWRQQFGTLATEEGRTELV